MTAVVAPRLHALGGQWRRYVGPTVTPPTPTNATLRLYGLEASADGANTPPVGGLSYEWSDSNVPWEFAAESEVTAGWPAANIVPLNTAGTTDFYTQLNNTINATSGRVVIRLPVGVFRFNQFRLIGTSGDQSYSFGFWHSRLQGFIGAGADQTFVQMDANSMSAAQLDKLASMTVASFAPNQMSIMRFDGSAASPVLLGGVTFRAADQNLLASKASDLPVYVPQPAPHQGIVIYYDSKAIVSHCRFQGAGRAMNSQPPFEMANVTSQRSDILWRKCEFDGRRSPDLDPSRPRRCGVWMGNNEVRSEMVDCWLHHSNLSRYAANDQNATTSGPYILTRCKIEQITNTQNRDPAINGGTSLGGYTDATPLGWESISGTVTMTDCIVSQDNTQFSTQVPMHLQFTYVGSRNPQGGRCYVYGTSGFKNTGFPAINGFAAFRIQKASYWYIDGYNTTLFVYSDSAGTHRLSPHEYTGTWPPTAAYLSANSLSPSTHYIVRAI